MLPLLQRVVFEGYFWGGGGDREGLGGNAAGIAYREEGLGMRAGRIAEPSNQVFQQAETLCRTWSVLASKKVVFLKDTWGN